MKYGCIGERLKHSFSKEIHNALADYEYEIREIPREDLHDFMEARDFSAINVTIPYKEDVIPYLYYIDDHAKNIGAVNTIVNRCGKLYGYNTDFYGMTQLIRHAKISLRGRKIAILGTGGTSKTAAAVARAEGASEIIKVSRTGKYGAATYGELYEKHNDTEIILNTTPEGMYPNIFDKVVNISAFPRLCGVIDVIYNPLRTPIVSDAQALGIAAEGGLYMLVAQAVRASEIFLDKIYPEEALENVFSKIFEEKENIVLTGMPASGKSTVGHILSEKLGRQMIDTDDMIVEEAKMPIKDIFEKFGEKYFRDLETKCVKEASARSSVIIATGGGVPLREENVKALKENGKLFFLDRPLELLIPTDSRPLSSNRAALEKRYNERYGIYCATCDVRVDASPNADLVAKKIIEDAKK